MATLTILGIALAAYLCGMVGSFLGAYQNAKKEHTPGGENIFIFILLFQVFTFWPVQVVKVSLALGLSYFLAGSGHALLCAAGSCFIAGYGCMLLFPIILKALKARNKK